LQVGSGQTIPVVKDAQVGSGQTIPVVREALTLRQRALNIWVFVSDVREEFILGLGTLRQWTWDAMGYDRPGCGASERDAYGVGVVDATHRESQELAAGVLAVREDRSLEGVS
jgi:hypothetical protein